MKKQFIVLTVLVSVALTASVYAETSTVDVPFISHGMSCYLDELEIEYHCTWQGTPPTPMTIEELEEFKDGIHDRIIDDAIAKIEAKALEQIKIEQAILTPNEQLIEQLQSKIIRGVAGTDDIVLLEMLEKLDMCQQGLGRSAPIQEVREFEISLSSMWKFSNLDYDNRIGKLAKSIEECRGQYIMENKTLSAQYEHIVTDDTVYDHRESFAGIQAIPFDKFTSTSHQVDMSAICDNNQFSIEHRQQFDCYITGHLTNEQVNAENKISGNYNESGVIVYKSKAMDKFNAFMNQYGNINATDEDKQREIDKASIIVEELLSANPWYDRD
jgi:hypothetical protein